MALAIVGGAALSFYALIGFEDAVNVAEETKDPAATSPRRCSAACSIAGVIYLLVTFTASMVVPTQQLTESDGPLLRSCAKARSAFRRSSSRASRCWRSPTAR